MEIYFHEYVWFYFYCVTAPTASESAKQIYKMTALRVMPVLFYECTDMNNGAQRALV